MSNSDAPDVLDAGYDRTAYADALSRVAALEARAQALESERDAAVRTLRRSTEHYHALINSIDVGFCILEMLFDDDDRPVDYRFIETNRAFDEQTGLVNAVGQRARTLVPGLEEHWFENYGAVAVTGRPLHFEQQSKAMDRWFDVYAYRLGDPERRRVALLFTDITTRKLAEQEAHAARESLQTTIDSITDGLLVMDRDWCITYVSRTAARMIDVPREQMIGRPIWKLFPRSRGTKFEKEYRRALETGEAVHFEEYYPEPLNQWLECHAYPSGAGLSVYFRDVTDRKRREADLRASEQRLRLALSAGETGAWEWDLVSDVSTISDSYRALFGLPADTPFTYEDWLASVHPDDRDSCREYGEAFFSSSTATEWRLEFRVVTQHRGTRWHRAVGQLQRDTDGRPLRFIGVSVDITEHKQAEEALREARRIAEDASHAKGQFLAVMSHELRTPLNGVIGYADLLESGALGPTTAEQLDALGRIKASSWHLVGIIDDVLATSRAEAGKEEVRRETMDLAAITRSVAQTVEPEARSRRIELIVENVEEPLFMGSDPGKIRQILVNLAGNAAKFTERGSIAIRLDIADADWVRVHVSDTGPGIAAEYHEFVFSPFTQVDGSAARSGSGTGLGLSISRRLARLLDGDVTLDSTPGVGSTFTLHLPRHTPSSDNND
jgi:PAS domain S-box-containing protein